MQVKKFFAPPLEENSYILFSQDSKEGFIIDPGSKPDDILKFISKNKLKIKAILNTHGHFDHTIFNQYISDVLDLPILINPKDLTYIQKIENFTYLYNREIILPRKYKEYKEELTLNKNKIIIMETPGHTPGGYSYYIPSYSIIFTGDTLFKGAFGRYDLPNGNFSDLKLSIKELFTLPDKTIVYSGHGKETTIAHEKKNNYILRFI